MITVAVVGSREYPMPTLVAMRISHRVRAHGKANIRFVSGGAPGTDTVARKAVEVLYAPQPAPFRDILPDYGAHGRTAPLYRNIEIADEAQEMDAFWDRHSPGTPQAVEHALAKGIPVYVFGPRGERVDPQECVKWLDRHRPTRQRPVQRSGVA